MFDKISTALITIVKANTRIQSVYDYEASNLEGFPAATVIPSSNDSDYSTTTEDRRKYSFVIRLYVERLSGQTAERTCEATMRDLVDTLINNLNKTNSMASLATQTGYIFLKILPTPSVWGYAGEGSTMRVAEVKVSLEFDVDTTLIS